MNKHLRTNINHINALLLDAGWADTDREKIINILRERLAAAPEPDWTVLANIIREVDGNHDLGAGELAERIIRHPRFRAVAASTPDEDDAPDPPDVSGSMFVRLDRAGVITRGQGGPFLDPDKVLELAARAAAPSTPDGRLDDPAKWPDLCGGTGYEPGCGCDNCRARHVGLEGEMQRLSLIEERARRVVVFDESDTGPVVADALDQLRAALVEAAPPEPAPDEEERP